MIYLASLLLALGGCALFAALRANQGLRHDLERERRRVVLLRSGMRRMMEYADRMAGDRARMPAIPHGCNSGAFSAPEGTERLSG